jgi:hypothetical protein
MYTNIPTDELLTIIESACEKNVVEDGLKHDIIKLLKVIMDQNYFQFMGQTYVQHESLANGAPMLSILSEFYLQHLENSKICNLLLKFNIVGYFRHVDDLLIVYNVNKTDIEDLLNCFNNLTPKLNFTIKKETRGSTNFLDITIHREDNFSIDVYRKLTCTDSIIHNDSATLLSISTQQYATYTTE